MAAAEVEPSEVSRHSLAPASEVVLQACCNLGAARSPAMAAAVAVATARAM